MPCRAPTSCPRAGGPGCRCSPCGGSGGTWGPAPRAAKILSAPAGSTLGAGLIPRSSRSPWVIGDKCDAEAAGWRREKDAVRARCQLTPHYISAAPPWRRPRCRRPPRLEPAPVAPVPPGPSCRQPLAGEPEKRSSKNCFIFPLTDRNAEKKKTESLLEKETFQPAQNKRGFLVGK